MRVVHVLGNPTARGGQERLGAVVDALTRRGVEAVVLEGDTPEHAAASASAAVAGGAERLICIGGDGVVRIAVGAVAGTDTVLGIVPLGTGNDFARAIGLLKGDVEHHVADALADPVAIDAIRSNHGWVASVATIGFSGDVTARANALSWPRGQLRYTVATLLQLPRLRTLALEVTVDGVPIDGATTLLAVGNTAYFGGGMRICPDARPDDGLLHVVSIGDVSKPTFVRVFPTVFAGRHVRRREVEVHRGSTVTIAGGDDELWADGDVLGPLPATLEAVPGAVRIAGARTR
jgi:diacylglycerol kinase (ATP)